MKKICPECGKSICPIYDICDYCMLQEASEEAKIFIETDGQWPKKKE